MAKQYQVTAPCVTHVPVAAAAGTMLGTFYQDAVLPSDVPADRIKHLLDSKLIVEVGGAEPKAAEPESGGATPRPPKTSRS